MKLKLSFPLLLLVLLLFPSLALAAPTSGPQPQPDPAASQLFADLTPGAPSCNGGVASSLTPEPLLMSDPLPCGSCSGSVCSGKFVGEPCGIATNFRCVIGPACTLGAITCLCKAP